MNKTKKAGHLLLLEFYWRLIKYYEARINKMICRGIVLSDKSIIKKYHKLEEYQYKIMEKKMEFEQKTGEKIVFIRLGYLE